MKTTYMLIAVLVWFGLAISPAFSAGLVANPQLASIGNTLNKLSSLHSQVLKTATNPLVTKPVQKTIVSSKTVNKQALSPNPRVAVSPNGKTVRKTHQPSIVSRLVTRSK